MERVETPCQTISIFRKGSRKGAQQTSDSDPNYYNVNIKFCLHIMDFESTPRNVNMPSAFTKLPTEVIIYYFRSFYFSYKHRLHANCNPNRLFGIPVCRFFARFSAACLQKTCCTAVASFPILGKKWQRPSVVVVTFISSFTTTIRTCHPSIPHLKM